MFTITLQIGCYEKEAVEDQFCRFITRKGWGKAKKPVLLSEENGYFSYQIDVFVKDPEGMVYEVEMMSCGRVEVPAELSQVEFGRLSYRVIAIPQDLGPEDVIGLVNHCFTVNTLLRSTLINVMGRLERIEEIVGDGEEIVDEILPGDEESPTVEIEEGKTKWLH